MKYGDLDPINPKHWGPSVRYERILLTPESNTAGKVAEIQIGCRYGNGIVTALRFSHIGLDCSVQVGRDNQFDEIPRPGANDIAYSEGFPIHIEDTFKIIWTATGDNPSYKLLLTMAVLNIEA